MDKKSKFLKKSQKFSFFAKMAAIRPNFNILSSNFANMPMLIVLSDSTMKILGYRRSCRVTSKF